MFRTLKKSDFWWEIQFVCYLPLISGNAGIQHSLKFSIHANTLVHMLTVGTGEELSKRANLDLLLDMQSDLRVKGGGGYTNKLINRMLCECFLMDGHRKVDLSGSLAASGGEIHHVMTGRRGLWRLGLPWQASACQLNEAPSDRWCGC